MNNKQLSRQLGEHLVVAELARMGILATPFAGNVPDIDLLIYANGKSLPVQVKALCHGSLSVDVEKYLHIKFKGDVQIIRGKKDIERELIFILVQIGNQLGYDKFYIYEQGVAQDLVARGYSAFLKRHNGIRPKSPKSTHGEYHIKDLAKYENNWSLIAGRLGIENLNYLN